MAQPEKKLSRQDAKNLRNAKWVNGKRGSDGKIRVALFSDFFNSVNDNFFFTNSMFSGLKDEILSSIGIYGYKEQFVLNFYVNGVLDEDNREVALLGFQRYIASCYRMMFKRTICRMFTVLFFAAIGVFLEFFIYGIEPAFPPWILGCMEVIGWVLIWECVHFWSFEFIAQKRILNRLKQIKTAEYEFNVWS